jgi:hypothetical protein
MIFHHQWGGPSVAVVKTPEGPLHTPQQVCGRCGTSRNALTREIVRSRRSAWCEASRHDAAPPAPDYRIALGRLRQALDALERDGLAVDREYGRRPRLDRAELPLAYKD